MTVINSFNLRCEIVLYFSLVISVIHQVKKKKIGHKDARKIPFLNSYVIKYKKLFFFFKSTELSYAT